MFNGQIKRGQRWLQEELAKEDGREKLVTLAHGGVLNLGTVTDPWLPVDFYRLQALFLWAADQEDVKILELSSTIEKLPDKISPRQRKVLLRDVARVIHPSSRTSISR